MLRLLPLLLIGGALSADAGSSKTIANSLGMKFVLIPAGTFVMGSPETEKGRHDDEPQHEVTITRPFYLGVHEVTQEQFEKVMGRNPSSFSSHGSNKQRVAGKSSADYPVDNVTWLDAVAFCEKLGALEKKKRRYRLPSEAEWEYACRAGSKSVFHLGDNLDAYKANFCGLIYAAYGNGGAGPFLRSTTSVGQYEPNAFGLYDMHGNVQEWCRDWYAAAYYPTAPKEDPQGPLAGAERVLRGGGWAHTGNSVRSAVRNKLAPNKTHYSAGFRVVLMP
jgi:formylglycine-generating enzyme required for sulfatase activity